MTGMSRNEDAVPGEDRRSSGEDRRSSGGAPSQEPAAPVRRIDHVAIAAHDADAAATYYEGTLGMRRVRDEEVAETGSRLVWLEPAGMPAGGARFQIVQPLRPGPVAEFLAERGEGLHHVCFAVDDAARFLSERGEPASALFTGGFGLPCAFLGSAPEGMAVEIVQPDAGA